MPRFGSDDADKTSSFATTSGAPVMGLRAPALQMLKRGRPMEPRVISTPCLLKCCAEVKDMSLAERCFHCVSKVNDKCSNFDQSFPEDEFDDDFDLGPPPPCGPVLVRQNAMDLTASTEAKFATLSRKMDMKAAALPLMMPARGSSVAMPTSMLFRRSRTVQMN